jgi:hypothetical protein
MSPEVQSVLDRLRQSSEALERFNATPDDWHEVPGLTEQLLERCTALLDEVIAMLPGIVERPAPRDMVELGQVMLRYREQWEKFKVWHAARHDRERQH